jgi:hypothetical protein
MSGSTTARQVKEPADYSISPAAKVCHTSQSARAYVFFLMSDDNRVIHTAQRDCDKSATIPR